MRKILFIYHSNICNKNCGINSYLYNVFKILNKKEFKIDIFVPDSFDDTWDVSKCNFIDKIFLDNEGVGSGEADKNLYAYLKRRILKIFKRFLIKQKNNEDNFESRGKLDWINDRHISRFEEVLSNNKYECVIFSYVYYSKLANFIPSGTLKICSVSDFVSIQQLEAGNYSFGDVIDEEIEAINKFDKVFFISSDEMFFFSNFLKDNIECYYVPHFLDKKDLSFEDRSIDILFLGSDNNHNITGINWFLKDVYPRIIKNKYKIVIAGKITDKINKEKYPDIEFIGYVDNLDSIYNKTKLSISPLKSGTGIKIKIVEALAYGLPVVCTSKSLVGFMEKNKNGCIVADKPREFSRAICDVLEDGDYRKILSAQSSEQFKKYFGKEYAEKTLFKMLN